MKRVTLKGLMAILTVAAMAITGGVSQVVGAGEYPSLKGITVDGAGASFPYPLYALWAAEFEGVTKMKLNYQSIGSGGGIAQIKAKTVNFGASDEPLKAEVLDEAGLVQFPMIIGGVVPVVNIPGVAAGKMKLTPDVLAKIFLGQITKWNDPAVKALNPGLALPNKAITVAHRSDGSGTTWIFTNYLTKVSPAWRDQVGNNKSVKWPVGVGGNGNAGVANNVKQVEGAIGYVEYAYALQSKLAYVQLKNKAGSYVLPTEESFQAAAANAEWDKSAGFYVVLTDQPGKTSWPIVGASFILIHKEQADPAKAKAMLTFFDWAYRDGGRSAGRLDYVAIPETVYTKVENMWKKEIKSGGAPVWQ